VAHGAISVHRTGALRLSNPVAFPAAYSTAPLALLMATALAGFLVGGACAWGLGRLVSWALGGIGFGAVTFSTNVITLRVGLFDVMIAALLAALIGLAGGMAPAWRAAKLRPVEALRKG